MPQKHPIKKTKLSVTAQTIIEQAHPTLPRASERQDPHRLPDFAGKPHWNYELCEAWLGSIIVGEAQRPTFWHVPFTGQRRKCVKIKQGDEVFYIDDEDGSGYQKVFERGGGPDTHSAHLPANHETWVADELQPN